MSTEADGNPVRLTVKREGVKQEVSVTPVKYQGRYVLGIDFQTVQMNLGNALKYGVAETFFMIRLVIYSLLMLITGKVPITEMAGPVGAGNVSYTHLDVYKRQCMGRNARFRCFGTLFF